MTSLRALRMGAVGSSLVLATIVLAGCSDAPRAATPAFDVTSSTGVLHGIVVDATITPIADAKVKVRGGEQVERETVTDAAGLFVFGDMPPGEFFLTARKPGFQATQASATVQAGVPDPQPVRMQLEVDPAGLPYHIPFMLEGFIECSLRAGGPGVGNIGVNVCDATTEAGVGTQKSSLVVPLEDGTPTYLQAELVWESTQTLGSSLTLVVGPPDCTDTKYSRADGTSPQVIRMNGTQLEGKVGPDGVCFRVFTWLADESQGTLGATLNQKFTLFVNAFYHYAPPADWTFHETNEVPPAE